MASPPVSPAEPTKKHPSPIQPNAHPYAIKTTSSALLSRSNSSPHSAHHTRHHYVPFSPSRIQTGSRVKHRHSASLSLVEGEIRDGVCTAPAQLPTPPSVVEASQDSSSMSSKHVEELKFRPRVRRAETMPLDGPTDSIPEQRDHEQESRPELYAGLPLNPKQWNTDQLVTYLKAFLVSGNNTDGDLRDSVLAGILEHVRTRGLTGRELLRLTDADLARTSLSDVQRARLLERSRSLRAEALRGRIYVDSYHSHEVSDHSNHIYSQSVRSSTSFHSIKGASMSADDLRLLDDNHSGGVFPSSPVMSLPRSDLVSEASAQRYKDLARMRMRRRGRVKGLIETWERASMSGSECSASEDSVSGSEADSESQADQEFESTLEVMCSPESPSDLLSASHDEPVDNSHGDSTLALQEPPSSPPPPPYTHLHTTRGVVGDEEEPTIEELLASSSGTPLKGARAWEADFGLGETVKRIPVPVPEIVDAGSTSPLSVVSCPTNNAQKTRGDSVRSRRSGGHGSARSRGKNTKTQRVVTAIFTGSPPDNIPKGLGDEVDHQGCANGIARHEGPGPHDESDNALQALEESIAEMRTQMDAFRLRLEEVEADNARREVELERTRYSDTLQSSEYALRRRQLQGMVIDETEMANARAEEPGDKTLADGFKNEDTPEEWKIMSLGDIARTVAAKAIGWLFPFAHLGGSAREGQNPTQARTGSCPGVRDSCPSPAKRSRRWRVARMSCSIVLVSFAICAAVLRRMGFGRWIRRP